MNKVERNIIAAGFGISLALIAIDTNKKHNSSPGEITYTKMARDYDALKQKHNSLEYFSLPIKNEDSNTRDCELSFDGTARHLELRTFNQAGNVEGVYQVMPGNFSAALTVPELFLKGKPDAHKAYSCLKQFAKEFNK